MRRYYMHGRRVSLRQVTEYDWPNVYLVADRLKKDPGELWNEMYISKSRHKDFFNTIELNDPSKTVIGFCRARGMRGPVPTVSIFIFEDFRRMGYGYESMCMFLDTIQRRKKTAVLFFNYCCRNKNLPAQALAKKLGAGQFHASPLGGTMQMHKMAIARGLKKEEDIEYLYSYSIPCSYQEKEEDFGKNEKLS